ncbi:MAG: glycogen debranching protein GlgX [Candidatus Omnitrophica bacterium]|nr:glycogen debranching protein GlgX [Candidatus Omnitrophota bacterium]
MTTTTVMEVLKHQTQREIFPGEKSPLGATIRPDGVNFAVFSQHAHEVFLLLFDNVHDDPTDVIKLNRTDNVWHVFVKGIKAGHLYGYKANGDYNPGEGQRFNPYKLLMDPYAKAVSGKFKEQHNLIFPYDLNAQDKDLVMDQQDNASAAPKSIVIDDNFEWQGDKAPGIPMEQLIIYEVHVKGFTAHPSSGVKEPGTYLGFIEKIPHLKKLGINAVELMPVHEFFIRHELVEKGLSDYWGYNTIGFFAPESSYSTQKRLGCQVDEFKTLVRELHKAGIEVILDVVYNHTGEGNHLGPSLCFKGLDNSTYYSLVPNPDNPMEQARFYLNDTGCGNVFNVENQIVMGLVLDSLKYWVTQMHVDGFRFDLAGILARVKGHFSHSSAFFEAISGDPVLNKVKLIAEPWDLNSYHVGKFPQGWSEWNDKFRDTARRFLKGDRGQAGDMAKRLTGSADLYEGDDRKPYNSINFITCHDGFTLKDLFSYNEKHNEANHEANHDGHVENYSWNCGVEGNSRDDRIIRLRKQMVKNALSCLMFSAGTPMLLFGDEMMRTQKGNNNAYCQDNELGWLDWNNLKIYPDIFDFCIRSVQFRRTCPLLRRRRFFSGENKQGSPTPDISWFGRKLDAPRWNKPLLKTICYQLAGHEAPFIIGDYYLFFIFNMNHRAAVVHLPQFEGLKWYRLVDTSQRPGEDFRTYEKRRLLRRQDRHYCAGRTVNVLWAGV